MGEERPVEVNGRRRAVLGAAAVALLHALPAWPQPPSRKRVIWVANFGDRYDARNPSGDLAKRVRGLFARHGLVDGRDVTLSIEEFPYDESDFSLEASQAHIRQLVGRSPDVIVMHAYFELFVLAQHEERIPIVFYNVNIDPSRLGLVASLRRPSRNITGTYLGYEEMMSRNWQALKQIAPGVKRAGTLYPKRDPEATAAVYRQIPAIALLNQVFAESTRSIESSLGLEISDIRVARDASPEDIAKAVRASGAQALYVPWRPPSVMAFVRSSRLPSLSFDFAAVREGVLLGTWWDAQQGEAEAAGIVERILHGESPATIPVSRMTKWKLAINRSTARSLGLEIPSSLALQADTIFD